MSLKHRISRLAARTVPHDPSHSGDGDILRALMGSVAARDLRQRVRDHGPFDRLAEAEFRVFSQFGDDGIIQYLLELVRPEVDSFVEFGVEDYTESNTRFLLTNDNWRGLVIDGSESNVAAIRSRTYSWRHELHSHAAFVDRDNIDALIAEHGFSGSIGLLSIDIDGVDFWVWERLSVVRPAIVVAEYNSVFGRDRAVSVPYDPRFSRNCAHPSRLYWGCSLKALCVLAERKGYAFVGSNSAGNNAYFVQRDRVGSIPVRTVEDGYVESRFRESRDSAGRLTFVSGRARLALIGALPLVDVETGTSLLARDLA